MTTPKGMDELLWGKDLKYVFDWVEKLQMATKVHEYDEEKFFKIAKLIYKERPRTGIRR